MAGVLRGEPLVNPGWQATLATRESTVGVLRGGSLPVTPRLQATLATRDRFWQPKYYAFQIYGERKLIEKLDYLHLNPVRAGLVKKATDWRWSSARWYESQKSVGVPISWIE